MVRLRAEAPDRGMDGGAAHRHVPPNARGLILTRILVQAFLLGLPLWWVLGIDWALAPLLAAALVMCSLSTFRRFTAQDYLLLSVILSLGMSAYINGLIIGAETTRALAAFYNLAIWISGFVMVRTVRELLKSDPEAHQLLRSCFVAFVMLLAVVWTCLVIAYAFGRFYLEIPSVFGRLFGHMVPDSAPLIRDSTRLTFSQADWGLPNFPMARIAVYGPYPTATAATVAVLGSMALLHLHRRWSWRWRWHAIAIPLTELLIIITIATTLTRSILGGWLFGAIAANLIFGSSFRRIAACALLLVTLSAAPLFQGGGQTLEYRSYSSESRFENYLYAAEQTFRSNPVFGLGIKPREEGNHIAVGSHSTFVSAFTKGGTLGLSLVVAYFVLAPALSWFVVASGLPTATARSKAELRILFNLQVALWVWLCFEDIDAPASAALLIFFSWAFIQQGLRAHIAHAYRCPTYLRPYSPYLDKRGEATHVPS